MLSVYCRCSKAVFFLLILFKGFSQNWFWGLLFQSISIFTSSLQFRNICSYVTSFPVPTLISLLSSPFFSPHSFTLTYFSSSLLLSPLNFCLFLIPSYLPFLRLFPKTTEGETSGSQRKRKEHRCRKGVKPTLPPLHLNQTGFLPVVPAVFHHISMSLRMPSLLYFFPTLLG